MECASSSLQPRSFCFDLDLLLLPLGFREAAKIYGGVVIVLECEGAQRQVDGVHQALGPKRAGLRRRHNTSCEIVASRKIAAYQYRREAVPALRRRTQIAGQHQGSEQQSQLYQDRPRSVRFAACAEARDE